MRLPGVVPLVGVKVNQAGCAPTAATVYGKAAPPLIEMPSVVVAGTLVLNTVKDGLPVITIPVCDAGVTVSVTLTVCEVNPDAEMAIEPT